MAKNPNQSNASKWSSVSCSAWFGPVLDAFWPTTVTAAPFLLLVVGPFYTKKPEDAFRRLREALEESGEAAAKAAGPTSLERLKELSSQIGEIVDPGYYQRRFSSDKYRKTDTYQKKPERVAETRISPVETQYCEALLAWLYQFEPKALSAAEQKLQRQLEGRVATAAGASPARRAAEALAVFLRQLSSQAAGLVQEKGSPLPPGGVPVYPWPERRESEAAAYLDLVESYSGESVFYLEGLRILRRQGNRYAIGEMEAIYRVGRCFRCCDGSFFEIPADDAQAAVLRQELRDGREDAGEEPDAAGSRCGDPLPERLRYLKEHRQELPQEELLEELQELTQLPSLDAGMLLWRVLRQAGLDMKPCAEFLMQNCCWQGTADCYDMMLLAGLSLSPQEIRRGGGLGSIGCLRQLFAEGDPALPRLLSQALLRPDWNLYALEELVSLYRSLDDRQGHATPLWELHDALTEQLENFYRWEETLTVAERRARKDDIRQAEDALEQMQSDVEEMLRTLHFPGNA